MSIDKKSLKKEYELLIRNINYHNKMYHTYDSPEISDSAYDKLYSNNKKQVFKDLMLHAYGIKFHYDNKNQIYYAKLPEIIKLSLKKLNLKEPSMKYIEKYFNI